MPDIQLVWNEYIQKIANNRSWAEIIQHFVKHLSEMAGIIKIKDETETLTNKKYSMINLTAIAIVKMGGVVDFQHLESSKLLERLQSHEKRLADEDEQKALERASQITELHAKIVKTSYDDEDT